VAAPITAGQEIAHLVLEREGMPEMRLPLVAEADVPRGGFVPRVTTAFGVLLGKAGLRAGPARGRRARRGRRRGAGEEARGGGDAPPRRREAPRSAAEARRSAEEGAEGEGLQDGE
jgi:D-alanyl-D-alanine carboxypeptidase (penicillin-binding protein 5/6)